MTDYAMTINADAIPHIYCYACDTFVDPYVDGAVEDWSACPCCDEHAVKNR